MKLFIALSALLAVAVAVAEHHHHGPVHEHGGPHIPIVHSDSYHGHDGSYKFAYESGNGITAQEEGFVKNGDGKDHAIQVAHGSFSYKDPKGVPVSLSYVADEHGFQASGSHIPTPPPVPQELIDAYAKAASQPHSHDEHEAHYAQPQPQPYNKHY